MVPINPTVITLLSNYEQSFNPKRILANTSTVVSSYNQNKVKITPISHKNKTAEVAIAVTPTNIAFHLLTAPPDLFVGLGVAVTVTGPAALVGLVVPGAPVSAGVLEPPATLVAAETPPPVRGARVLAEDEAV